MATRLPYLLFVYRVAKSKKAKQQQQRLTSKVFKAVFMRELSCYQNATTFANDVWI